MTDASTERASGRGFPLTRYSLLTEVRTGDAATRQRALDLLLELYWRPVYKYLRIKWQMDIPDAEDLTQEFFVAVLEKDLFAGYDPSRARFRTFLRVCVDRFRLNKHRSETTKKRGGGTRAVPLDFSDAENELRDVALTSAVDPEDFFRKEWVRSLFGLAVASLEERCKAAGKQTQFAVFSRYDLDDDEDTRPTYAALAAEFNIPITQVTNYLAFARREFRRLVLEHLAHVSASEEEYRSEARELLGIDPG